MNKQAKRRLMEVLLNHYKNKQCNKLSIKEITEQAGVSRMTFYRHFKDLNDLKRWVSEALLMDSLRYQMAGTTLRQGMYARLNRLKEVDYYFNQIKDELEFSSVLTAELERIYFFNMLILKQKNISMEPLKGIIDDWEYRVKEWMMNQMSDSIDSFIESMLDSIPDLLKEAMMSMHENVAVSGCLLGELCKYDGKHNRKDWVVSLQEKKHLVSICPEMMGGLPCPRPSSEVRHHRVINIEGDDVTLQFQNGAKEALCKIKENGCTLAVLKAKSPSCGIHEIYDGTFTHTLLKSDGITARLLIENNIPVVHENELLEILKAPM